LWLHKIAAGFDRVVKSGVYCKASLMTDPAVVGVVR